MFFFFFSSRRRHTRFDCDWSSDVCSSDLDRISRREQGMTPYEVMLSESQERMLILVRPEAEAAARQVFDHFELHAERIGVVTGTGRIRIRDHGVSVADIPL